MGKFLQLLECLSKIDLFFQRHGQLKKIMNMVQKHAKSLQKFSQCQWNSRKRFFYMITEYENMMSFSRESLMTIVIGHFPNYRVFPKKNLCFANDDVSFVG